MKQKRCLLLHDNGRVTKAKESLSRLIHRDKLERVKYVLIPIPQYESIYMAVAGDFLQTFRFHHAKILYHMRMMGSDAYDFAARRAGTVSPPEDDIVTLYDYNVSSVTCLSLEEFYQALHQFFLFSYIERICDMSEHSMSTFTYMQVSEMEIQFLDAKERITHTCAYHCDHNDVPFQISANHEIAMLLTKEFGLNLARDARLFYMPHMSFSIDEDGRLTWKEHKEPVQLFSHIHRVLIPEPFSMSYAVLDSDDYDICLRMESGAFYVAPIDLHGYESARFGPPKYMLPITGHFRIPRFNFYQNGINDESPVAQLFQLIEPTIIETFLYEYTDPEDIVFAILYMKPILRHYVEFARACASQTYKTYVDEQREFCTALAEFQISLDDTSYTHAMLIATDGFQQHFPTIEEVCILLDLEENTQ